MLKKLGSYVRGGLAAVVLTGAALTFSGCDSAYHEIFRDDETRNIAALSEPIEINYKEHDKNNRYDVVNDRAYLREGPKPSLIIEKIVQVPPYERFKVLGMNATYIEDANNIILQYNCRTAAPDLVKRLGNYSKDMLKDITIDTFQNTLVFSGKKQAFGDFDTLNKLLNEFDKSSKQIRVRVKVVEMFYDNTYDREFTLSALKDAANIINLNLPSSSDPTKALMSGVNINPFYNQKKNGYTIESGVKFLDSYGKTRTLSDTDQLVTNGDVVKFTNITNVPYRELLEGKVGFVETIKYRDTGTTINVTPFANEEGFITLKLDAKSGEQTGFVGKEQYPVFREAEFTSNITVRNGMPYLAATSVVSRYGSVQRGVPLIDKLPVLKEIFTSRSIENNQSQLICFVEAREIGRDSSVSIMRAPNLGDFDISNHSLNFETEAESVDAEQSLLLK